MQYAQRLLAALPSVRSGLRAILAVLTAFGIVLATAGVAAMPLLNAGNAVEDYAVSYTHLTLPTNREV